MKYKIRTGDLFPKEFYNLTQGDVFVIAEQQYDSETAYMKIVWGISPTDITKRNAVNLRTGQLVELKEDLKIKLLDTSEAIFNKRE